MTWPQVMLKDVVGVARNGMSPEAIESGTLYVGLEHIDGEGNFVGVRAVDAGELASAKFAFSDRHILFGKLRPYLKKTARPNFAGICSTDILPLEPREEIDRDYLFHVLRRQQFVEKVTGLCAGANLPRISPKVLGSLEIPVPPLPEQRRIAAILDKADALRAKRREAIAKLDQLLQSVFLDMFGNPLANDRAWPMSRIGDVCSPKQWPTITGKQLKSSGYPVYGANGVIGFYSSYNHEAPTVLITCRGATCGTINICEARSYVTGNAMALNSLDASKVELVYMATMLRIRGVNEAITGAAQPQITREKLSPVSIPVPPLLEQSRFARIAEAIAARRTSLQTHDVGFVRLFSSLQHRAFSGTL